MYDIPKMQRYKRQVKFIANQMVQIVQAASANRSNKRISLNDLKYAACSAYLTVYPGISMHTPKENYYVKGFYPECEWFYVKGEANGRASVKWRVHGNYSSTQYVQLVLHSDSSSTVVRYRTNVVPSEIYPTLTIREGEYKIIIECHLRFSPSYHFADGRLCGNARNVFGFLMHNPRPAVANDSTWQSPFVEVAIFTPHDGMFDETPPK